MSGRAGDDCVAGGIVGEAVLADCVAERAGQGGHAPAQRDAATSGGELIAHEAGDMVVGEILEADRAQRGGEVLVDVVDVAGQGRRLEPGLLVLEPAVQVVRHGLSIVDVDPGLFAGQDAA